MGYSSSGYWVGKKSLQNWRRLRLQRLNASYESADMVSAACTSGTESEIKPMDECSDKAQTLFNADLLCEHGELTVSDHYSYSVHHFAVSCKYYLDV